MATLKVSIVLRPFFVMETKNRIKQKAHELFMRLGIRSVSMDDIAASLGMSKKTIYQYYADKDELVDAVMDDEEQRMQLKCQTCVTGSRDAIDEIFRNIQLIYEQFSQMNPMVLHDLEKFHPKAYSRFLKMKNEFLYTIIYNNIRRGISEELYRPEINADVLTKFRLESMMFPFNIILFPPSRYSLAEVSRELTEHFLFGLASQKGYKQILKYKQELLKRQTHDKS